MTEVNLLRRSDVAEAARVSVRTVDRWIGAGELAVVRVRGAVRVRERDFVAFIDRATTTKRANASGGEGGAE